MQELLACCTTVCSSNTFAKQARTCTSKHATAGGCRLEPTAFQVKTPPAQKHASHSWWLSPHRNNINTVADIETVAAEGHEVTPCSVQSSSACLVQMPQPSTPESNPQQQPILTNIENTRGNSTPNKRQDSLPYCLATAGHATPRKATPPLQSFCQRTHPICSFLLQKPGGPLKPPAAEVPPCCVHALQNVAACCRCQPRVCTLSF